MRALAVLGNVNLDLIVGPLAPWPEPGTEVTVAHHQVRAGGAAGNVALAWQELGIPFQIAANVGNDAFGQFLRSEFGAVADRWPVTGTSTTLSIGVTHPSGERTFITPLGHLNDFTVEQALSCIDENRLRGGILLTCGSFVMPQLAAAYDALFEWADARSIEVALDTGWPPDGWSEATIAATRGWIARCHHLLLNEVEAVALSRTSDPEDAAQSLVAGMQQPNPMVVVKQGPRGALACSSSCEIVRVPALDVAVIDTIGAGDAFNAGYLASVAAGQATEKALRCGVKTASAAISAAPRVPEEASLGAKGQLR